MLRTLPGVPRWAKWAAHAAPLTVLPSGLWRLALGFGIPVGFTGSMGELYAAPGWITLYVTVLSLFVEGLALLTLGLVQPWGEVVPRWVPLLGGRRIPTMAAVVPAVLGAIGVLWFCLTFVREWFQPDRDYPAHEDPSGLYAWWFGLSYAPMLAWGPLLLAVTIHYYRRRRTQR
ncbi:hypothetical protein E1285_24315 [Actinomadura sp. 7K507]|nr:hypothetical protein E1285_24315 [Actinomadura sp. 7K507]